MPIIDPDQGVPLPAGTDLADNPAAFSNFYTPVMSRLILRYTNAANRALLHPAPVLNETSILDTSTWFDRWTGAKWLPATPIAAVSSVATTVNNSTVLTNVTGLVVPLPVINTFYAFEAFVQYNGNATADIKFGFSAPAGADVRVSGSGASTGAATSAATGEWAFVVVPATIAFGAVGANLAVNMQGHILTGAATGNLQLQFAQNVADPSNTAVFDRSWLKVTALA